jgi:sugar phosphate permease
MSQITRPAEFSAIVRRRWIIWASLMGVYIIGTFHRVAPAVIAKDLMNTFQMSGAALGALSSSYFYIYSIMQIPSGILADTVGPRKTVALSAVVISAGTILFALSPSLAYCFAGRFLIGLGVSVVMVNAMKVCVEWYRPAEMGLVNGLITTVGALGGILAATPLAFLSDALGWRLSFVLIGIVTLVLGWNCWLVVRDRPADSGLPSPHTTRSVWAGIKKVVMNPYTWPPFFGFFSFYSTFMAFVGLWGVPFISQQYGLLNKDAANYTMVASLGLLVGCPLVGYLSDRVMVRRKMPYVLFAGAYAAVWAMLCFLGNGRPSLEYLYGITFLMGFFCSGFTLSLVCTKEVNPGQLAGIAMGTTNTGGFLGAAILQVVLGKVLDLSWDGKMIDAVRVYPLRGYRTAFLICFCVSLLGIVAATFIKETRCENYSIRA